MTEITTQVVRDRMAEDGQWRTSAKIWHWFSPAIGYHKLRRRIQSLHDKGLLMRRVYAQNGKNRWNYKGPIYEYKLKTNLD